MNFAVFLFVLKHRNGDVLCNLETAVFRQSSRVLGVSLLNQVRVLINIGTMSKMEDVLSVWPWFDCIVLCPYNFSLGSLVSSHLLKLWR